MSRDRIGLGALLALTFVVACGESEGAPSRPTSGRSSNSSSADEDAKDDEQEQEEEAAQDEEEAQDEEPAEDEEVVVDEPEPAPPRRLDAGVPSAPAPEDEEEAKPPASAPSDAGRAARDAGKADASVPVVGTSDGFDAGSGELQPDGQTVIYRIPDGTGRGDWNPKDKPIRVKPGMVLRFIDEDTTARGDGHWLHTFGQPCPHSSRAIGEGYDCKIRMDAPTGIVPSTVEHSPSNFGGRVYIEVVREGETASSAR